MNCGRVVPVQAPRSIIVIQVTIGIVIRPVRLQNQAAIALVAREHLVDRITTAAVVNVPRLRIALDRRIRHAALWPRIVTALGIRGALRLR